MGFNISDSVLQISEAFCEINLQEVTKQVLQFGGEMRRKSNLEFKKHEA